MEKDVELLYPSEKLDFWKIKSASNRLTIKWSGDSFDDYKKLGYNFYECGYKIFTEVICSGHDNEKSDSWFFTGIFLIRQGMELGLKSLICRISEKNKDIQDCFKKYSHNLLDLYRYYNLAEKGNYLSEKENGWLGRYLKSLENIDERSDTFRFPFQNCFFQEYENKYLDNTYVANNMIQAFSLIKKCLEKGKSCKDDFNNHLDSNFFVYASHGIGNCYLWHNISDDGFYTKTVGYVAAVDFVFNDKSISKETKFYPMMFMFRNIIELFLKQLLSRRVYGGVPLNVFNSKKNSHLIKKVLWKNVKPIILKYSAGLDVNSIEAAEKMINTISNIDKKGDTFRYPTAYNLEYFFDDKDVDVSNVYEYMKSLVNFLDNCNDMLSSIADYQDEIMYQMTSDM